MMFPRSYDFYGHRSLSTILIRRHHRLTEMVTGTITESHFSQISRLQGATVRTVLISTKMTD
jgi:hypothetical protein